MRIKTLFPISLALAPFTSGYAQTPESIALNPDVLDRYVGVYSSPDAPAKATVTRDGPTLFFQPPGASSGVPLEATAEDKFQIEGARAAFEFDAARNQMTVKRPGGERVFTKEK